MSDCDLSGGDSIFWWNGSGWQYVQDLRARVRRAGSCINFTVDNTTTPNLDQLRQYAVFGAGRGRRAPTSSSTSVPGATAGHRLPGHVLAASGGVTPETWLLTSGSLPPGLSLDATTGALWGTPTTAGTYDFTVAVTDSEQTPVTVTEPLEIVVAQATTSTGIGASASSAATGTVVTYTATVTSPVTLTGTVDFSDAGSPISTCQNVSRRRPRRPTRPPARSPTPRAARTR